MNFKAASNWQVIERAPCLSTYLDNKRVKQKLDIYIAGWQWMVEIPELTRVSRLLQKLLEGQSTLNDKQL